MEEGQMKIPSTDLGLDAELSSLPPKARFRSHRAEVVCLLSCGLPIDIMKRTPYSLKCTSALKGAGNLKEFQFSVL
jgi:hypothetical protein